MLKKNLYLNILFIIFCIFLFNKNAYSSSYTDNLDKLYKNNQEEELFKALIHVERPQIIDSLNWLKLKAFTVGDSRFFYTYSRNLYRVNIKDTSSMMLITGMLLSREDAERCADKSGTFKNIQAWEFPLTRIKDDYKKMKRSEKDKILNFAKNVSSIHKNRKPNKWVCQGGMSSIHEHLSKKDVKIKEVKTPEGSLGRTYEIDTSSIEPKFITDKEWIIRKKKASEKFLKQASTW